MSRLTYRVEGGPAVHKLMNALSGKELNNRTRRAVRRGVRIARKDIRAQAQSRSDIPNSFSKTITRYHRTPIGASTQPSSPLFNIFEGGAGTHEIAPGKLESSGRRRLLLAGPAGERWRSRTFLASEPVHHPGMKARPLVAPVFEADKDEMTEAAMTELLAGLE